jgi:hypothetical protein
MSLALIIIPDPPTLSGEYGRMDSSPAICWALKIPRFGLMAR